MLERWKTIFRKKDKTSFYFPNDMSLILEMNDEQLEGFITQAQFVTQVVPGSTLDKIRELAPHLDSSKEETLNKAKRILNGKD